MCQDYESIQEKHQLKLRHRLNSPQQAHRKHLFLTHTHTHTHTHPSSSCLTLHPSYGIPQNKLVRLCYLTPPLTPGFLRSPRRSGRVHTAKNDMMIMTGWCPGHQLLLSGRRVWKDPSGEKIQSAERNNMLLLHQETPPQPRLNPTTNVL